jgi:hypothetical protein
MGRMPFEIDPFGCRADAEAALYMAGVDLACARQALDAQTEIARAVARAAAAAGVAETVIAAELGVARSPTVRAWLGKGR